MTGGRRWLLGCGIGCAVPLLLGLGACVVGMLYLGHAFRGIEKAEKSYEALVGGLGTVDEYVPPASGVPERGRLELFVEVREEVSAERRHADGLLAQVSPRGLEEGSTFDKIRNSLRLVGNVIDGLGTYVEARNGALLERGMSVGEYVYLYTLVYHSWLGHAPGEGPKASGDASGVQVHALEDDDALFGEEAVRRRYRRYVLGLLERQLAASTKEGGGEHVALLRDEIHRMEVDPGRVLWKEGVPPAVAAALEPFRARLAASWSAGTNRVELPLAEHETPWD